MAEFIDETERKKLNRKWVDAFKKENDSRRKQGKKPLLFRNYKKQILDQIKAAETKVAETRKTMTGVATDLVKDKRTPERRKTILDKKTLETAKVAAKAGVKSAISPKKAFVAGTGLGLLPAAAWIAHDMYKAVKKDKKKKRQESGTKHLGKKAYGGKIDTYRSPRRTTYND